MKQTTQFNLLAALCLVAFVVLSVANKPDAQAMSALALVGTLTGRGKSE